VVRKAEKTSGWKSFRRRYLRPLRNTVAGRLGAPFMRLWIGTLRVRWYGKIYRVRRRPTAGTPGIYVFWHQGLLTLATKFRNSRVRVVISSHGDGELIARIVENLGMYPVRGSTTRGGSQALLELLRESEGDGSMAITPDGPRGPKHHFHNGAIYLASRTGLPIHTVSLSHASAHELGTWDNFLLPLPFSRALVCLGEPITIPPDVDRDEMEKYRVQLEDVMQSLTRAGIDDFERIYANARPITGLPTLPAAGPAGTTVKR
jgi:lysophospholipid acyltransferase (LPLAT)-like uncharacterized protein